jgi:hypothetical protein
VLNHTSQLLLVVQISRIQRNCAVPQVIRCL